MAACEELLGVTPVRAEPGSGDRLKSLRVHLPDRTVIATRRKSPQRAELEAAVLGILKEAGAPVPAVLAFDGTWMIQEDLGTRRVSRLLRKGTEPEQERLLNIALHSLTRIYAAADSTGLQQRLYTIGSKPGWLEQLIATPAGLGEDLGVPAPDLPQPEVLALLSGRSRSFVKWDARPANSCVTAGAEIAWFNWEHCGRRNRLDDLDWVLCDEAVPDRREMEDRLIAGYLPLFDDGGYGRGATAYLSAFGTFHSCIRLSVVLSSWLEKCNSPDAPPLSAGRLADAMVLVRRGARWSARNEGTAGLEPWFEGVQARLETCETT